MFPTLSDSAILDEAQFDGISEVCRSLYQTNPELKTGAFGGHLHQLDSLEGLLLSTSQMMVRGGGKEKMPGGDLLRMANNIIKLQELESYFLHHGNKNHTFELLTVSMDDFISDPTTFTVRCLVFLLGRNTDLICPDKSCKQEIERIANEFEQNYNRKQMKGSSHITTGRHSNVMKKQLRESLKNDAIFGPVLENIEQLVTQALKE